ncbi:hypothetical protein BJ508DRAFT_411977 [Ascobolus immersus RN42]|uniref:SMB domain-containing protein n=1 Tax=Ascobolus immersus RN42 TaxID=1160509 RepID=A0A3N4IN77_ASCIM|nr:hypothetical protein BJ508DRAFT_411977 [Ascobolus immersus RN42]
MRPAILLPIALVFTAIAAITIPNQTPMLPFSDTSRHHIHPPSCGEAITFPGNLAISELPIYISPPIRAPQDTDKEASKDENSLLEKRQLEGYWCCYGCTKDKLEGQCNYVCCQDAFDCCNIMVPEWWG